MKKLIDIEFTVQKLDLKMLLTSNDSDRQEENEEDSHKAKLI